MPHHENLTLANLQRLDMGVPEELFMAEQRKVVKDLEDRPFDKKPRRVVIAFTYIPVLDSAGRNLEEVAASVEVSSSMPKARTKVYKLLPKADGNLVFSPDLPDDPRNEPLFPGQGERINKRTGEVTE